MTSKNYLEISLEGALDEVGIELTKEQFKALLDSLHAAQEMEGEATGAYNIPNPLATELAALKEKHKREMEAAERNARAVEALALAARGLRPESAFVEVRNGRAQFQEFMR